MAGLRTVEATQPYERQPMWHRKADVLTVLTEQPGLRIGDGDWSSLTQEARPGAAAAIVEHSVFALRTDARTGMCMEADGSGRVTFEIGASADGAARALVVRLHLLPARRRHARRRRAAGRGRARLPRPARRRQPRGWHAPLCLPRRR